MRDKDIQQMFEIWQLMSKHVEIMRQYPAVKHILHGNIPTSVFGVKDGLETVVNLGQWVNATMTWEDSPALPRTQNVCRILDKKRGRCGEYAILYTGLAYSLELDVRLIFDLTDHVWTEVRLDNQWIPIDTTLGNVQMDRFARDKTKPLSYILAFQSNYIEDVTKTYTEKWADVEKRRNMPFIDFFIEAFNLGAEREDWETP